MPKFIRLTIDNGAVVADEAGSSNNKGNFCAEDIEVVSWKGVHETSRSSYFVKFRKDSNTGDYDWPFSEPERPDSLELPVPVRGQPTRTWFLPGDAIWKYEVRHPDATTLDPMIIVRGANLSPPVAAARSSQIYTVGAIAFLAGTVVGMLLSKR